MAQGCDVLSMRSSMSRSSSSLEDAFCAVMLNPNIAAVIIKTKALPFARAITRPVLRPMMTCSGLNDESDASDSARPYHQAGAPRA